MNYRPSIKQFSHLTSLERLSFRAFKKSLLRGPSISNVTILLRDEKKIQDYLNLDYIQVKKLEFSKGDSNLCSYSQEAGTEPQTETEETLLKILFLWFFSSPLKQLRRRFNGSEFICAGIQKIEGSKIMGWIGETVESIKSIKIRQLFTQAINLGLIVTSALMIWKALICITGSESPVVVVLSESMEPGFQRGDILFLHMTKEPVRAGEIVVFSVDGRPIPIVHRAIKVHERGNTGEIDVLTKGDNNDIDDIGLYAEGQLWLHRHHIMGRAVGFLPYVGWVTIIMTEQPIIKYLLIGTLGLLVITHSD